MCIPPEDHFGEKHEVKGWKLSLVDNPDGPCTKSQCIVMRDTKELRAANMGFTVEYGYKRTTSEAERKLQAHEQLHAKQGRLFSTTC